MNACNLNNNFFGFLIVVLFILYTFMWMVLFWLYVKQPTEKQFNPLKSLLPHKKTDILTDRELAELTDIPVKDMINKTLKQAEDKK